MVYVLHCVFSGVPWTEEEHKLFLLGIQKVGKGDWRGISRNFVKTRTPTQVASHAQKYFLRRSNLHRRRRRSSLFDITTETVRKTVFFYTKHNFFCLSVFELILFLVLEILYVVVRYNPCVSMIKQLVSVLLDPCNSCYLANLITWNSGKCNYKVESYSQVSIVLLLEHAQSIPDMSHVNSQLLCGVFELQEFCCSQVTW